MKVFVNENLIIPSQELFWKFSKSSGPGGQKINKTNNKVEIIFNLENSYILSEQQKNKIRRNIKIKLVNDSISLIVQENRKQFKNRQIAIKKMGCLIKTALSKGKVSRKKTEPSKESQTKRITLKKKKGELKRNRRTQYLLE